MPQFVPQKNAQLIVQLPMERIRATVRRIVNTDMVMVELTASPMAKTHSYKLGDFVPVHRKHDGFAEVWEAEREMRPQPKLTEETVTDAGPAGKEEHREQHPRTDGKRKAAKTERGDRSRQRKKAPDGNGRKRKSR